MCPLSPPPEGVPVDRMTQFADLSQLTMASPPNIRHSEQRLELCIPRNWINDTKELTMELVRRELIEINRETTQEEIAREYDRKREMLHRVRKMANMKILGLDLDIHV